VKVDGVWTSGIDYTVVNAFKTAGKPYVPVVGADNNEFLRQLIQLRGKGFTGAAVTNPAVIGGVGAAVAIKLLDGGSAPKWTKLTPEVWDMKADAKTIKGYFNPKSAPTYGAQLFVKPYTTYSAKQLTGCQGPS
jgi:ribose transport system substrate-binding protein